MPLPESCCGCPLPEHCYGSQGFHYRPDPDWPHTPQKSIAYETCPAYLAAYRRELAGIRAQAERAQEEAERSRALRIDATRLKKHWRMP